MRGLSALVRKELQLRRHGVRSVCAEVAAVPAVLGMMIGFWFAFKMGASTAINTAADYTEQQASAMDERVVGTRSVLFAPNSSAAARRAAAAVAAGSPLGSGTIAFNNEADLLRYYAEGTNAERTWLGLVVTQDEGVGGGGGAHIRLRYPQSFQYGDKEMPMMMPDTASAIDGVVRPETAAAAEAYLRVGTLHAISATVDALRMSAEGWDGRGVGSQVHRLPRNASWLDLTLRRFPVGSVEPRLDAAQITRMGYGMHAVPVFLVAALSMIVYRATGHAVQEKADKLRHALSLLGAGPAVQVSAQIIASAIVAAPSLFFVPLFLGIDFLGQSSFGVLMLWQIVVLLSCLAASQFVAAFFLDARFAALVAFVLFLASPFFVVLPTLPTPMAAILAMFPGCGIALGVAAAVDAENWGAGLKSGTLFETPYAGPSAAPLSFGTVLCIMSASIVVWLALASYIENILPPPFGNARSLWFPAEALLCSTRRASANATSRDGAHTGTGTGGKVGVPLAHMQADVCATTAGAARAHGGVHLQVRDLHCSFGSFHALRGVSTDLVEGICVLLGHNGAGKTTFLNILTGALQPTAGSMTLHLADGRAIHVGAGGNSGPLRGRVGVCPQYNTIWPTLTVRQHLDLVASVKGESRAAVDEMLRELHMADRATDQAGSLSGGWKRRLCVGMALMGRSPVVVVDEASTGVDPVARLDIWDLLRRHRTGRIIIVTTHDMDEAEALGETVTVLAKGRVRAAGTLLELKSRFGLGYLLTFVKTGAGAVATGSVSGARAFDVGVLLQRLQRSLQAHAQVVSDVAGEIAVRLPRGDAAEQRFPQLFEDLDAAICAGELGVSSYGVSVSTMDDVFYRLATELAEDRVSEGVAHRQAAAVKPRSSSTDRHGIDAGGLCPPTHDDDGDLLELGLTEPERRTRTVSELSAIEFPPNHTAALSVRRGSRSALRQLRAIYRKRLILSLREPATLMLQLVLPLIFVAGCTFITLGAVPLQPQPGLPLVISPSTVGPGPWASLESEPRTVNIPAVPAAGIAVGAVSSHLLGRMHRTLPPVQEPWQAVFACIPGVVDIATHTQPQSARALNAADYVAGLVASARVGVPVALQARNDSATRLSTTLLWNASLPHALPLYASLLASSAAAHTAPSSGARPSHTQNCTAQATRFTLHPLPPPPREAQLATVNVRISALIILTIGVTLAPAAAASSSVQERVSGVKAMHMGNGLTATTYHTANWLADMTVLMVNAVLTIAMSIPTFADGAAVGAGVARLFVSVMAHHGAVVLLSYVASRRLSQPGTAQGAVSALLFFLGFSLFTGFASVLATVGDPGRGASATLSVTFAAISPTFTVTRAFAVEANLMGMRDSDASRQFSTGGGLLLTLLHALGYIVLLTSMESAAGVQRCFVRCCGCLGLQCCFRCGWRCRRRQRRARAPPAAGKESLLQELSAGPSAGSSPSHPAFSSSPPAASSLPSPSSLRTLEDAHDRHSSAPSSLLDDASPAAPATTTPSDDQVSSRPCCGRCCPFSCFACACQSPCRRVQSADHPAVAAQLSALPSPSADVAAAEQAAHAALHSRNRSDQGVVVSRLQVVYPPTFDNPIPRLAVGDLSFTVERNECLAIAGANGAGKSTTFAAMAGLLHHRGSVRVAGTRMDSVCCRRRGLAQLGVCPQFDTALSPLLTPRETLQLYADIKGLPRARIAQVIDALLALLQLQPVQHRLVRNLSGGNRRRVSLAVALLGCPAVLVLDEVTAGVDPVTRKRVWAVIAAARAGKAVLATSHSVAECEALGTRVCIMLPPGRIAAIGTPQQVKALHGRGMELVAKLHSEDAVQQLVEAIAGAGGDAHVAYRAGTLIRCTIYPQQATTRVSLGSLFRVMYNAKAIGLVEHFSLGQASLEQVFMALNRQCVSAGRE